MNLEEHIYYSCAAYSSIHPNRAAVLNHLFCVIGNGYEWENGELVECCGDTTTKSGRRLSVKAAINQVFRNRRKNDEWRKKEERRRKREEKKNPPDKVLDSKLDKLIEDCIAAERKAKEADPVAYEAKKKKLQTDFEASAKRWKAEQRWSYRVPKDIEKRVKDTKFDHWYPMCEYSRMVTFPDDVKDEWLAGIIETCKLVIANPPQIDQHNPAERIAETTAIAQKCLERAQNLSRKHAHEILDGKRAPLR